MELSSGGREEWSVGVFLEIGGSHARKNTHLVSVLWFVYLGGMGELQSENDSVAARCFTADEADWTDDDVIVRVLGQSHCGTDANFDLFVLCPLPVFRGNPKEDLVRLAVEFVLWLG